MVNIDFITLLFFILML